MDYLKNLKINNFRGLKNLEIDNLKRVNIFVGNNNAGKTSILEAIQIFLNPTEYTLYLISVGRERYKSSPFSGLSFIESMSWLFNFKGSENNFFEIEGKLIGKEEKLRIQEKMTKKIVDIDSLPRLWKIRRQFNNEIIESEKEIDNLLIRIDYSKKKEKKIFQDYENFKYNFEVNEYSERSFRRKQSFNVNIIQTIDNIITDSFISEILNNKEYKDEAVKLLKFFDKNILDIRMIRDERRRINIYLELLKKEYIPISLYGDGIKKALSILNKLIKSRDGILLIDEYEMSLHTSIMNQFFRFMIETSKKLNIQLFLTTHSLEAVDKLLKSNKDNLDEINVIRLRNQSEKTYAKVIDGKKALENREDYEMELRV